MKTLYDSNFRGKKVLVRCDFNVPLDKEGHISNDFRVKKALPTIDYLIGQKAKTILISHLGRPPLPLQKEVGETIRSKHRLLSLEKYSLRPVALLLSKLLKTEVKFLDDCIGEKAQEEIDKMADGGVMLLENLRFYKGEEANDYQFARELAKRKDVFIQDAFSVCHRNHASVVEVPEILPSWTGILLEREVRTLSKVLKNPERPFVAIIGGVKITTKVKLIEQVLKQADQVLLGGKIANVILQVKGMSPQGNSLSEEIVDKVEGIKLTSTKLHLPLDAIVSLEDVSKGIEENYFRTSAIGTVKQGEAIYDIGPETINVFKKVIKEAKTIIWSGPLGLFEKKPFERGTKDVASIIVENHSALKIAGGGDTIFAISKFGLIDGFNHISTGGGAMLRFLSRENLPGIVALGLDLPSY